MAGAAREGEGETRTGREIDVEYSKNARVCGHVRRERKRKKERRAAPLGGDPREEGGEGRV